MTQPESQSRTQRLSQASVGWPADWSARIAGDVCSLCEAGRPEDDGFGIRIFAGEYADAYLQRAKVQKGYTKVIWRGRHVVEPTDLSDDESVGYWQEVILVARALQRYYQPLKMNYETLGNVVPHLHTHLLPRYQEDPAAGQPFPIPVDVDSLPTIPEDELRHEALAIRSMLDQLHPS